MINLINDQPQKITQTQNREVIGWLLEFYILATSNVITMATPFELCHFNADPAIKQRLQPRAHRVNLAGRIGELPCAAQRGAARRDGAP